MIFINLIRSYYYLEIFPSEQLYTHDGKDEPEDETHEQHVEDGRYRLHQRVHHHLPYQYTYIVVALTNIT